MNGWSAKHGGPNTFRIQKLKVRGKPQISQRDVAVTTNRRLWFWFSIYSAEGAK
jgi:hypothetical protein